MPVTQSWGDIKRVHVCTLVPITSAQIDTAREAFAQILIDASNGASDYGNKFGEPLVAGYTRSFGLRLPSGDRREWIKPIMFRFDTAFLQIDGPSPPFPFLPNPSLHQPNHPQYSYPPSHLTSCVFWLASYLPWFPLCMLACVRSPAGSSKPLSQLQSRLLVCCQCKAPAPVAHDLCLPAQERRLKHEHPV